MLYRQRQRKTKNLLGKILLFITYANQGSISVADGKTPQVQQQKKYMVEIISETGVYNMGNTLAFLRQLFSRPQFTPLALLNDGEVIQFTGQDMITLLLIDLIALKPLMVQVASNLNKENKNQVLNSEIIRSLLLVILGTMIQGYLQTKDIKVANQKILTETNNIVKMYLTKISNRDAQQVDAAVFIPLREAIVSFLIIIANDSSIKIMINGKELNKAILKDNRIIDLILSVMNFYIKHITSTPFLKVVGDTNEEVFIKVIEESEKNNKNNKNTPQKTPKKNVLEEGEDGNIF